MYKNGKSLGAPKTHETLLLYKKSDVHNLKEKRRGFIYFGKHIFLSEKRSDVQVFLK